MILDLIPANSPILKQEMERFDFSNPPVNPLDLVTDLAETMLHHNGIGLAANQCGLPYRVFVMNADELIPCFNPIIVHYDPDTIVLEEGCLSNPNLFVKIKRPRTIKVRYTEPNGNTLTRVFDGMTARIFQHELSHLNGENYIRLASSYHREQARNQQKKANRQNKELHYAY
jgi:peptide deformylase